MFNLFRDDDGNTIHRRDFRMRTLTDDNPIEWFEIAVEDLGNNNFRLEMELGDEGYRGFFIEVSSIDCRENEIFYSVVL